LLEPAAKNGLLDSVRSKLESGIDALAKVGWM
jgi:hypothetical protein